MADETRKNFLSNLLGKKEADTVTDTLDKAKEALDAAKVTRKSLMRRWKEEGDAAALVAVVTDTVVGALAESGAVQAIVASPDTEAQTPEEVKSQVEQAVGAAIDAVVEEVTVTPEAAEAVSTAETETAPASEAEMKSLVKSLGEQIGAQTKDSALIAQAVLDISGVLKDVLPAIKSHDAAIAEIKGIVAGRPRQASKALETETENPELEKTIKAGIEGEVKFLGIPVKPLAGVESGNGSKKG